MEVPKTAVPGVATGGWLQTGLSMDSLVKMPKFSSIKNYVYRLAQRKACSLWIVSKGSSCRREQCVMINEMNLEILNTF